jgi:hypothetical protein
MSRSVRRCLGLLRPVAAHAELVATDRGRRGSSPQHNGAMDSTAVEQWVAHYERLWRTPGTQLLAELFAADASYRPSPWARPVEGLEVIARFWEAERVGADEEFTISSDVVAVDAGTAVVRVFVTYGASGRRPWRDLWVLRMDADGRCTWFEEWPFAPGQPDGH